MRNVSGNASSTHRAGQFARQELENARRRIARLLNISPNELVFTSGGTESNNLALAGVNRHVITTAIEHPAVLEPLRYLEQKGIAVTRVGVNAAGVVDPAAIERELREDTALVSVMHANNETGAVQPLPWIAAIVRRRRASGQALYLHCDGVQGLGKLPVDLAELGVDLYSMSAHKIHGPKGVGALFVKQGTPLESLHRGGRHERGRRAGTENVPGIMAFAHALELAVEAGVNNVTRLRDRFERTVMSALADVEVNTSMAERLPNTSSLLFRGISGEALLIALDTAGFAVSTGSACASGSIEPSHVLLAAGRTISEARSSVRFSFGRFHTEQEIDQLSGAVISSAGRLRARRERRLQLVAQ
jgi:cysteine desulfurase